MRILHVNHRDIRNPKAGGLEKVIHEISRKWVECGHEVLLACANFRGGAEREEVDGIQIFRMGKEQTFNFTAGLWLRRNHGWGADIIIEHLSKVACFLPWFLGQKPLLAHVPHLFGRAIFEEVSWPLGGYVFMMERMIPWVYGRCPLWATSPSTAEELVCLNFPKEQIGIIFDGLDADFFKGECHPAEKPMVLYVGRLRKYKGVVDPLLGAWFQVTSRNPEARLVIVGKGDYENELRRQIERRKLGNSVEITGFVDEQRKLELMRSAWCLVYPSAKEGWGLSVIEAASLGVPTIASDSPGLRDAVRDGETGLLVPHNDPDALAGTILRLINDRGFCKKLGEGAKNFSKNFGWDITAKQVLQFIRQRFPSLP